MGKIIRDGNVISTYNYEKTVDQSDFIAMITKPNNANIVVPEGVEKISDYAFYGWNGLLEVDLPNSVTRIGNSAFANCRKLKLKNNRLPSNLTILKSDCFDYCSKLILTELPSGVTSVPRRCFSYCSNITNIDLSNIKSIDELAFDFSGLTNVVLGEDLTSIGNSAFSDTKLTSITIPSKVTSIPWSMCARIRTLTKVIFKGKIETINSSAFMDCPSIAQFDLRNNTVVSTLDSIDLLGHASGCKIVIPNSLYDTWTTATNWSGLTDVQWIRVINSWNDSITAEGDYVLMSDLDLTDIRHLSSSAPVTKTSGLYASDGSLTKSWVTLLSDGDITVTDGAFKVANKSLEGGLVCDKVEGLISLEQAFYDCSKLSAIDISNFDTSKVTNMNMMFTGCSYVAHLDLSNFRTSQVTDMTAMFNECHMLKSLNLSSFDTSKVTNMSGMFAGLFLTSLDLSNFDTSNVTEMYTMFGNCYNLTSLDLSSFNTSNVTGMGWMFQNCSSLTDLDLSNFDTSKVTNMMNMFSGCGNLTNLDISNFDFSSVTDYTSMFDDIPVNCEILVKDQTAKDWITSKFSTLTNVKIKGA